MAMPLPQLQPRLLHVLNALLPAAIGLTARPHNVMDLAQTILCGRNPKLPRKLQVLRGATKAPRPSWWY
eukprot:1480055-Amphidinium_carterae.1